MMNNRQVTFRVLTGLCLCLCAGLILSSGAWAQPGAGGGPGGRGHGPMMNPEKMKKAAELEAGTVARILGLSAEQSKKLTETYQSARSGQMEAMRANRPSQGGRPDMEAMRKMETDSRTKLETDLKAFLNPEQTSKAMETLGTFGRRWDSMVLALDGMGLEEKTSAQAYKVVADHVAASAKSMESARKSNDFSSIREAGKKQKADLDAEMAKILSAEQLKKWTQATAMRSGRGGPEGHGGPGGPGGAGGGPDGPPPGDAQPPANE